MMVDRLLFCCFRHRFVLFFFHGTTHNKELAFSRPPGFVLFTATIATHQLPETANEIAALKMFRDRSRS